MSIFNSKSEVLITCPRGAAPILAEEIKQLNFPVKHELTAAVETFTTIAGCMRLNLHLRTAQRVQFQLASFRAYTADDVYKYIREYIDWDEIISRMATSRSHLLFKTILFATPAMPTCV